MPNYNLRMETDSAVIEQVRRVRSAIDAALTESGRAPLKAVLTGAEFGPAYVVKVLDVHPCLGKVAGRRLLKEIGVGERTRLEDLTAGERQQISDKCRCHGV